MPRICPDTTDTAPNSPIARALHRITPYNKPHLILGKVICQNTCQPRAPSTTAASSSSRPWACIRGINSRAINGKVIKAVANTIPGTAKIMVISWSINQRPNQLLEPNISKYIKPTTTGDIENGRSINVSNICLPLKSNLAIARSEEHTSELQSRPHLVCRLLLEKK